MSESECPLNLLKCDQGQLAIEEWKILQGKITEWGKQMFVIRGWLITILSGLTVALFTTKVSTHTYFVVAFVLILILMLCELIEAAWQRKAIRRASKIEESLRGESPYDGPMIGNSLSASAGFADYFSELQKHLILGFYVGLIGLVTIVWAATTYAQSPVTSNPPSLPPSTLQPPGLGLDSRTAVIFFFGLFWSSVLSATSVFQVFDTRLLFRAGERLKGIRRLVAGIIIIDIFPLILLVGFLLFFPNESAARISTIVASAILSISVFSAQRFLHSVVATRWSALFYSEEDALALKGRGKTVDALTEHLVPAIGYLLMPIVVSMAILWLF